MRSGVFAGLFGDCHLGDTELEGGHLSPALAGVGDALRRIARRPELLALLRGGGGARDAAAQLTVLAGALAAAAALPSRGGGGEEAAVVGALRAVAGLAPGEFAVLPGG